MESSECNVSLADAAKSYSELPYQRENPRRSCQPMTALKSKYAGPWIAARIRRSRYTVQPSFSQLWFCVSSQTLAFLGEAVLQVLPAATRDQIAAPAVCKLVGNHIYVLAVSRDLCLVNILGPAVFPAERDRKLTTVGVAKVYIGFSMPTKKPTSPSAILKSRVAMGHLGRHSPPYGNDGGRTSTLYWPHWYGKTSFSATSMNFSMSRSNSH